jgi:primosomal protein N'
MTLPFCNVALPVPLRTTFTYAVAESLQGTLQPGSRVLVPFRKKTLVGVVVELAETAPEVAKVREIMRVLDFVPALTPKLIELAHWIASYYLAPIGEVFRVMLPPLTELKSQRTILLTESGREAAGGLSGGELSHGLAKREVEFLAKLRAKRVGCRWGQKQSWVLTHRHCKNCNASASLKFGRVSKAKSAERSA